MASPTPNHPCSSSFSQSESEKLKAFTQELRAMLESKWNQHLEALKSSSSSSAGVPFLISEDDATTTLLPHQDTTSHELLPLPTFDLNTAPIEFAVGVQGNNIPPRIRLTHLKRLARAKNVELENPGQKNECKNKLKDSCAGSEENLNDSSQQLLDAPCQSFTPSTLCRKRNRCPGRNRISDSGNARTCHQCHQKTMNFVASCKSGGEEKPCRKAYCVQCLWNRYDEKAEVANQSNDWRCPYCRLLCNCSSCMRKRGLQPAGIRGRGSNRAGFRSTTERLAFNGAENINEAVNCRKASATKERVPCSDGRTDAGSSSSKEVHLSSELNPRVGVEKEKSERVGGGVKDIIKTVSIRNDPAIAEQS